MVYIISKPTRRELRENLAESRTQTNLRGTRGRARNAEEAVEIADRLRREEGTDDIPVMAVDGESAESKQARIDLAIRNGFKADPEAVERLF